jgi:hypothetical protein
VVFISKLDGGEELDPPKEKFSKELLNDCWDAEVEFWLRQIVSFEDGAVRKRTFGLFSKPLGS